MELCMMCGCMIKNAETPYVWQQTEIVCVECWRALAAAKAIAVTLPTPTEPPPPPPKRLHVEFTPGPRPAWTLYCGDDLWATIFADTPGTLYRELSTSTEQLAPVKESFFSYVHQQMAEATQAKAAASAAASAAARAEALAKEQTRALGKIAMMVGWGLGGLDRH